MPAAGPAPQATRAATIHPAIAEAFAALDAAGITWCLLRGGDELDRVDGDVDLLVGSLEMRRLRDALAAPDGFHPRPSWGRRPHHFLERPLPGGGRVKLDVVTQLSYGRFGELPTAAAPAVLAGRRRAGGYWAPAEADAFWATLLHALLDRDRVRSERAPELVASVRAARDASSPLRDVLAAAARPAGWDDTRVLDAVAAGDWAALAELAPRLRDGWPHGDRVSRAAVVTVKRVLRRAQRLQQRGSIAANSAARSTG